MGCAGDLEDNQTYGWIDNWEYNMKEKENCTERGEMHERT